MGASTTPQRPRKMRKVVPVHAVEAVQKGKYPELMRSQVAHFKLKGSPKLLYISCVDAHINITKQLCAFSQKLYFLSLARGLHNLVV